MKPSTPGSRTEHLPSFAPKRRRHRSDERSVAVIEGAVSGDDDHWHEALALAAENGLRPIAVDALEGLAVAAARPRELDGLPPAVRRRRPVAR